ncbi:hypothetical protein [Flavobacterium sp.]|uniref:hypothetical protein n=1 Tax=Flavobacterium sp. TaxID=239 RepID=UPI00262965A2|nr:hypothetical protein [Flavobacterium sp.]
MANVLKPEVKDFLLIPMITDVDSAPIAINPKMNNKIKIATAIASKTLIHIKIIPKIRIVNKNKLNSSSFGFAACKK